MISLLFLFLIQSCTQTAGPEKSEIVKSSFPDIAKDLVERDFNKLWQLKDHENRDIRALVWKAIAKSETNDLDSFVNYAIEKDDSLAWYALSLQPLNNSHIESINQVYADDEIISEHVCEVFFRKGTIETLQLLLNEPDFLRVSEICSKAVGGIMARVQADEFKQREVFAIAMETSDLRIWRNLLYGFYRSPLNRPDPESILKEDLQQMLQNYGRYFSPQMDEYIVRILGKDGFLDVMDRRRDMGLVGEIQLSVELAKAITLFESDELDHPYIERLFHHPVDNVVVQVLQSLLEFDFIPDELTELIQKEIAPITRDPEVFVEAVSVLEKNEMNIAGYQDKLEFMGEQNPLVKHRVLTLLSKFETTDAYLERIRNEVRNGGVGGLRALQSLSLFYPEHIEEPGIHEKVRSLTLFALENGDQNVFASLNIFLMNTNIIKSEDYDLLYEHYSNFVNSGEWSKAEIMESVFMSRFNNQFEPLTTPQKDFRIPNWNRLYNLGTDPFWILKTEKGTIEIQLDPVAAPFTVSSIDSLTRAGAYDNVPFHRVVRNFVAQGGDVSLKPNENLRIDYKLPTEPSYHSFERGMLGIASEGQDTEGGQFFIMLNWSPHLDGHYTIFGKVTKGMDVVDRIQIGDRLIEAGIYLR